MGFESDTFNMLEDNTLSLYFYLPGFLNEGMDFSHIGNGNPGIGGTEYLTLLIATLLSKYYKVIIFSNGHYIFYKNIKPIVVKDFYDCFSFINKKNSFFIVSSKQAENYKLYNSVFNNYILWAHTEYSDKKNIVNFPSSDKVKRCIFLTHYSFALYPKKIRKKSSIIPNPTVYSNHSKVRVISNDNNLVFVGAMVPLRGLYRLLKTINKLKNEFPDIHLYVCGGSLYNSKLTTTSDYENLVHNYVIDNNLEKNVTFLGNISINEYFSLFSTVKIGFTNIRYKGYETFCLSAVEMGSFSIPVIAGDVDGLRETLPKKCGYRIKSDRQLYLRTRKLLLSNAINLRFGHNYACYVSNNYNVGIVVNKWKVMIEKIDSCYQDNITSIKKLFILFLTRTIKICKNILHSLLND